MAAIIAALGTVLSGLAAFLHALHSARSHQTMCPHHPRLRAGFSRVNQRCSMLKEF